MTPISIAGGLLLAAIIGIIAGLIEIGGDAFLIPALIYFYGMSQIKAEGDFTRNPSASNRRICVLDLL